jgi:acyl-CoA synthetase (AMP-forming)/AMP-acid ligase II
VYLTQGLHRAVQRHPDRIAVRFGDRHRTFRQLAERVARLAGALRRLGMQTGDRVAMLSLNSDRYLEYQMAVPWGGGVLNPCNTRWSESEILYSLNDSGSIILLVDESFRPLAEQLRHNAGAVREVIYCGDSDVPSGMHGYEALLAETDPVLDALRRAGDLAVSSTLAAPPDFPKA